MKDICVGIAGGTGQVGKTLAKLLLSAGYQVVLGSRDPTSQKAKAAVTELQTAGNKISVKTDKDAIREAKVVILTFPSQTKGMEEVRAQASCFDGLDLTGKLVIDATNPLKWAPQYGSVVAEAGLDRSSVKDGVQSAGEEFSRLLLPRGAVVYKCFNTLGVQYFGKDEASTFRAGTGLPSGMDMMYAGPPAESSGSGRAGVGGEYIKLLEDIICDFGMRPVYVGPIRYSRNLEAIAELWVGMSFVTKARPKPFAFAVVDK